MLLTIQDRLKTLIEGDPYFAGVSVLTNRDGDIEAAYQQAIAKLSFCVVVAVPSGEISDRAPIGPSFRHLVEVSVCQSVLTDSQAESRNVADGIERVTLAVHGQSVALVQYPQAKFRALSHSAGVTEDNVSVRALQIEVIVPVVAEPED
jgi:hypothetical protein